MVDRWVDSTAACWEIRTAGSTVDMKAAGMDDMTAVLWVQSSVDSWGVHSAHS